MSALHRKTLACLLLACIGASWFACQCVLLPQETRYEPDWHGAQWMAATDGGDAPVAYFRRVISLGEIPDAAFITVAANQVFSLYVNSALVGSSASDFLHDGFQQTYMFDIASLLRKGTDIIALRVRNVDKQTPLLHVSLGVVRGKVTSYDGSSENWLATAQSSNVYHRYSTSMKAWTTTEFDAGSWPTARRVNHSVPSPLLTTNPQLYEQPIATHWLSAGGGQEGYFLKEIVQPFFLRKTWLRLAAVGTANVFVNGRLFITWNGQVTVREQYLSDYLSDDDTYPGYRNGLAVGIYDISAYLHPGTNTIAVHSVAPGTSAAQVGLANLRAAISLDVLTSDAYGHTTWLDDNSGWRASTHAGNQWVEGGTAVHDWLSATIVSRPGASSIFYVAESATPRNTQLTPFSLIVEVVLMCMITITALWLLLARFLRRFYHTFASALAATGLAFLPVLACEALLVVLFREPQMPPSFSYTWLWGLLLIGLFAACYVLIWLNARMAWKYQLTPSSEAKARKASLQPLSGYLHWQQDTTEHTSEPVEQPTTPLRSARLYDQVLYWLRHYWAVLLLMSVAALLVCYDLTYEPLWQDELSSYYAARGILTHGLPLFPSGFLYEKAELYSYLLTAWTLLFGDQGSAARLISALEYVLSIPLMYRVGCYFLGRYVSLLATVMLAFSPLALIWARQVRMYEQEQLFTLLVVYLFFKAAHEHGRRCNNLIYLAMFSLVIDYLTHEEMFIILPGLVVCIIWVMLARRDQRSLLLRVFREKHWWYAALAAAAVLILQWTLTRVTHPPLLGSDSSQRPFIQLTTDNVAYYVNLLFFPSSLHQITTSWMTMNSLLATFGCIVAMRSSDLRAKYCALFLLLSCLTLMLLFTMRADRYFYVLLPVYYLMGAYAVVTILRAFCSFTNQYLVMSLSPYTASPTAPWLARLLLLWRTISLAMLCAAIVLEPALPLSNYSLFVSRVAGFSYHRHYPDYDVAGAYLQHHWRRGDTVVSVVPDFCTYYYAGHVDYFFSIDRALFLLERNGHIVDTSVGAVALLNQSDFRTVLAEHSRIWIISDNGVYQAQVAKRFTFPSDFHIVYEGYGTAVYFRDG